MLDHNSPMAEPKAKTIYDFSMPNIDGKKVRLKDFRGKVLLVVNVASKCGYTPQYAALEKLYESYKDKGFVILGFPANNFREQEPGSNAEIKQFCTAKYGVTFPMFAKISVKGDDESPLYKWLIENSDRPKDDIEWNFTKFVIGKDGKVAARFRSKDTPDSEEVKAAIDGALSK
jgi:glutathione peroxidase